MLQWQNPADACLALFQALAPAFDRQRRRQILATLLPDGARKISSRDLYRTSMQSP
jgi:hypothetical protein